MRKSTKALTIVKIFEQKQQLGIVKRCDWAVIKEIAKLRLKPQKSLDLTIVGGGSACPLMERPQKSKENHCQFVWNELSKACRELSLRQ